MESWGKWFGFLWSAFCSQQGDHHVRCVSEEGLNPSLYDLCLEPPPRWMLSRTIMSSSTLLSRGPPLAPSTQVSAPTVAGTAAPHRQESRHANLAVAHSMERWSISLSQITLIILPIVQVPMTKGTLRPNSDSSGTTRNTASSSYPAIPCTCMCRVTNPSGLVRFLPNPTRFNG